MGVWWVLVDGGLRLLGVCLVRIRYCVIVGVEWCLCASSV